MQCSFCGYNNVEGNVHEMTRTEKHLYDGITIDSGTVEEHNPPSTYRRKTNYRSRYSGRTFYTSSSSNVVSRFFGKLFRGIFNNDLLAKIAATLIVVAISALMFFVALPVLFLLLAVGIALFAFSKFGR